MFYDIISPVRGLTIWCPIMSTGDIWHDRRSNDMWYKVVYTHPLEASPHII